MTMRQLAELTGCSLSTVSKAFSGGEDISEETRERIFSVAKEMGCYERYCKAVAVRTEVLILCPELSSNYYCELIRILAEMLRKEGINALVSITDFSLENEERQISECIAAKRAAGIIVIEGQSVAKKYSPIPIVYLNAMKDNPFADTVNTDFYSGICEAVWTFKMKGHTKIAYIGEALSEDKRLCFLRAMKAYELTVDPDFVIVRKERFEDAGFYGMEELYEKGKLPTAIFAAYDNIALGIIHSVENHAQRIPEDFSLVGTDDIRFSAYHRISLSSVRTNAEEVCRQATEILLEKFRNPMISVVRTVSIRSSLVDRNSIRTL